MVILWTIDFNNNKINYISVKCYCMPFSPLERSSIVFLTMWSDHIFHFLPLYPSCIIFPCRSLFSLISNNYLKPTGVCRIIIHKHIPFFSKSQLSKPYFAFFLISCSNRNRRWWFKWSWIIITFQNVHRSS